jgi:glycosyltransferase 2 family protein
MWSGWHESVYPGSGQSWKRAVLGGAGIALGGTFLWLAIRDIDPAVVASTLQQINGHWLVLAVTLYLTSVGLRCIRWCVLLRATDFIRWRHASESLLTGCAANYVLPGRVGELFRADYARRVFNLGRFTSLGTIVVERVCDGIVLVCALWVSLAWLIMSTSFASTETSWVMVVGAVASGLFGMALAFVLVAHRINLRRFGVPDALAKRWDALVRGISSILRGNAAAVVSCSIGVWALEALALGVLVRSLGVTLSPPENLLLLGLASLSTLVPTAPGYLGTYQLVFGHVFQMFGYSQTIGIIAATAVQIFCFGTVTILGGLVLLSRSGLTIWRAHKWVRSEGS